MLGTLESEQMPSKTSLFEESGDWQLAHSSLTVIIKSNEDSPGELTDPLHGQYFPQQHVPGR